MQNLSKILEFAGNNQLGNLMSSAHAPEQDRVHITQENATRTIYVADLAKSVTYLELNEFFESKAGTCQIVIKRPMFRNFYYAFVQFQKRDHAQKILSEHRFPKFADQTARVLPFSKFALNQRGAAAGGKIAPSTSSSGASKIQRDNFNLFVKGLPKDWNHEQLARSFEIFGPVASAKVSIDYEFRSRGYGFVSFTSEVHGQKAIKTFNGLTHSQLAAKIKSATTSTSDSSNADDDKVDEDAEKADVISNADDDGVITVTEYVAKHDRDGTTQVKTKKNLYVKNFPDEDFNDNDLRELFTQFGEVTSAVVMRDEHTGKSKQFGFVCFSDWRDSQKVIEKFKDGSYSDAPASADDQTGDNKTAILSALYVTEAKTKEERQAELARSTYNWKKSMQFLNLIVRNVDGDTTQEEFDQLFSNFGEIRSSRLHPESNLGFVCFKDRESANKAKNCTNLQLHGRPITANYCEPRESRQKSLEEKWDKRAYETYRSQQTSKTSNQDLLSLITSLGMLFNQFQQGSHQQQRGPGMNGYQNNGNGMGYRGTSSSRHFMAAGQQMNQNGNNGQVAPQLQTQQQMQPTIPPQNPQGMNMPGPQPQYPSNQNGPQHHGHHQGYRQRPFHHNNHHQNPRNQYNPQPMPEPMSMPQPQPNPASMPSNGMPPHPGQGTQPAQHIPPVLQPELSHQNHYRVEIFNLFNSPQFMNAQKEEHRKQMVGTAIFKHVNALAGEELAPKITGMIIDLPIADLNQSVSSLEFLTQKVRSAVQLLVETKHVTQEQVAKMPLNNSSVQQQQLQAQNVTPGAMPPAQ